MTSEEKSIIREVTTLFRQEKDFILNNWLNLAEKNLSLKTDIDSELIKKYFEDLINDFVNFLPEGDFKSYENSNNITGTNLALHNISYKKFIRAFHLFEDSYSPILFKRYSGERLAKCLSTIDKVHHNTIAIVTEAFFKVKDSTVDALVNLSELRDDVTGNHMERTAKYLHILAKELNLDDNYTYQLCKAGPLHDIGKIGIPDSILLKPGKLTNDEFEQMKKHTIIGAQSIEKIYNIQAIKSDYLLMARDIALYHHEKYDGSGYPEGLSGSQIPLPARIFALVDAYDAIVSKRPYKEALSHETALERIKVESGRHFDPEIVNAFLNVHEKFKEIMQASNVK